MAESAEIVALRAKLKARQNRSGFADNAKAIEAEIARLESLTYTYRDKATGQFVSPEYALANPDSTLRVEEAT